MMMGILTGTTTHTAIRLTMESRPWNSTPVSPPEAALILDAFSHLLENDGILSIYLIKNKTYCMSMKLENEVNTAVSTATF